MLRKLLAWKYGVVVTLILSATFWTARKDKETREQYEQKCAQLNASAVPPASHYEDCDKGAEKAAGHLPLLYHVFGWPEGITVWAILLTLFAIAEQTSQTRRAAEATLLNIQAFINSERPWIQIDFVEKERGLGIEIRAVNKGRTPAALISQIKKCGISEWADSLPENPVYEPQKVFERPKIIFPGEAYTLWWLTRIKDAAGVETESADHKRLIDMTVEGFMFGNVVYKDVLGGGDTPEHETRWCYHVLPCENAWGFWLIENSIAEEYTART